MQLPRDLLVQFADILTAQCLLHNAARLGSLLLERCFVSSFALLARVRVLGDGLRLTCGSSPFGNGAGAGSVMTVILLFLEADDAASGAAVFLFIVSWRESTALLLEAGCAAELEEIAGRVIDSSISCNSSIRFLAASSISG